jgi:hypothetical protein
LHSLADNGNRRAADHLADLAAARRDVVELHRLRNTGYTSRAAVLLQDRFGARFE